ncbi:hypothetical protein DDB_G0293660 [Dictyostelium discoideum AX4]|uniref:Uncharacterized protein n=1 Tax=Dictyostelium discoideum TaxID=44689 RepID=Q54BE8_DICDI|nr:hypothetical protein DDB_G0293660 [Dictyostelium discoideum AX4]EAL60642.1 hypothetical protein DDB_G0293660 [Dictyostelium discoideum AX4]|eukprot:XP_629081.1 hypothetical protein DDB_G0293660 [Dictyostelium discoideum AX4]
MAQPYEQQSLLNSNKNNLNNETIYRDHTNYNSNDSSKIIKAIQDNKFLNTFDKYLSKLLISSLKI